MSAKFKSPPWQWNIPSRGRVVSEQSFQLGENKDANAVQKPINNVVMKNEISDGKEKVRSRQMKVQTIDVEK